METTKIVIETIFLTIAIASFMCMLQVLFLLNEKAIVTLSEPSQAIRDTEITMLVLATLFALIKIGQNTRKGVHYIAEKVLQ